MAFLPKADAFAVWGPGPAGTAPAAPAARDEHGGLAAGVPAVDACSQSASVHATTCDPRASVVLPVMDAVRLWLQEAVTAPLLAGELVRGWLLLVW